MKKWVVYTIEAILIVGTILIDCLTFQYLPNDMFLGFTESSQLEKTLSLIGPILLMMIFFFVTLAVENYHKIKYVIVIALIFIVNLVIILCNL